VSVFFWVIEYVENIAKKPSRNRYQTILRPEETCAAGKMVGSDMDIPALAVRAI
jgi:hypothetical protein